MKRYIVACMLVGAALSLCGRAEDDAPEAYELGEELSAETFWKSDAVLFVKKHQEHGFKFTSEDRLSADSRLGGGVTCFGIPVYETRISFAGAEEIARVELMIFNTAGTENLNKIDVGDNTKVIHVSRTDGKMSREEFFKVLETIRKKLTAAGAKPPKPTDERTSNKNVRQKVQTWPKTAENTQATLMWNYTQVGKKKESFKPGFIRLAVDGPSRASSGKGGSAKSGPKTAKGAGKIVENVIRDSRGDVFIDNVPMVDQGMKGYCAVSAAERVMRYYGLDVDEHEIASAAGTKATEGTSTREMKMAVEAIGKRYKLATTLLYGDFEADVSTRIANLTKEVSNYNKAAKKLKKAEITEDMYIKHEGNMTTYSLSAVDEAMDAEVRKFMKTEGAQKGKYTKFRKDIHQYVDAGMPLYWGVMLGTYPEADVPQARGGHMRLIIGYNDKKDEILYTDTWGKGHELKRMPAGWAWTISHCLMVMKPLKK